MKSNIYFVKQDVGLFRKGKWAVALESQTLGLYADRQSAVAAAIEEAERTSYLGRTTEVWVNDGDGFNFEKAFKAQKGPAEEEKAVEPDLTGDEDILFTVDDPTADIASY
ncbi:MAG: hypothetical protein ABI306_11695 [Caulobacteraceae bacterium]